MRIVFLWFSVALFALLTAAYGGSKGVRHHDDGLQAAGAVGRKLLM